MEVSRKTLAVLDAANKKELLIKGYSSNQILHDFNMLIKGIDVEVGYRSSCGKTDNTHKVFKEWTKVIKQLKKDGFKIKEVNVKHANGSPTMAGGFWNSIIYSLNK